MAAGYASAVRGVVERCNERRRAARFSLTGAVNAATWAERVLVGGHAVNASETGLLVSFPGPAVPVNLGDRCLVSLQLGGGLVHLLGYVRRKAPGDDGRYYVGIELDRPTDDDLELLRASASPGGRGIETTVSGNGRSTLRDPRE